MSGLFGPGNPQAAKKTRKARQAVRARLDRERMAEGRKDEQAADGRDGGSQ